MNNENNSNSQKVLKISNWLNISENYSGIVERWSGTKEWYSNGNYHRTDGPAVEYFNGDKVWYLNGKLHRVDGPARELSDGSKEWWINGIKVNSLFFEIPDCEKYIDYYMTILKTELREHEEFLLKELKNQIESGIKSKRTKPK